MQAFKHRDKIILYKSHIDKGSSGCYNVSIRRVFFLFGNIYALYLAKRERQQEEIMNTRINSHEKIRKMSMYAILTAIVIVLQIICTFIKFGPFSITLALTPIIVGAAIYGPKCGAFLGFVFSAVVYITGLMGYDGGFINMMMSYSAIGTTILCLFKGTAAGAVAGVVYKLIAKKSPITAAITASAVAPITNTGLFALGIITVFYGFLSGFAGEGQSPMGVLFLSWIGINFIVEFVVNLALGSVVTRIVDYYNKRMR